MKKLFKFAFILVIAVIALTGCKKGDSNDPDGATTASFVSGQYYGDYYSNGGENFYVMLKTDGVTLTTTDNGIVPSGDGRVYTLDFISTGATNLLPNTETCPWADANSLTVPSFVGGYEFDYGAAMFGDEYAGLYMIPSGTYAIEINADTVSGYKYVTAGSIVVESGKYTCNFTYDDGTSETVVCTGTFTYTDETEEEGGDEDAYSWEPTEQTTVNSTYTTCTATNYGDYYGTGVNVYYLTLQGDDAVCGIELFTTTTATSIEGTYPISTSEAANTALSSPGGDDSNDYPCFVGTGFNEDGYYTLSYYMVNGSITITANGLSYDCTSYYGSTLTGSYAGTITVEEATTSILAKSVARNMRPARANAIKSTKNMIRNIK